MTVYRSLPIAVALAVSFLMAGCSGGLTTPDLERKYMNAASRTLPLDGMAIHYRDEGEGEPVLLLHGTGASLHTWEPWVESLKQDFRVIRLTLPGFGLTGPHPEKAYEVADDIRLINRFLDGLNVGPVHVAGSSLGGRIAWQMALEHPDRLRSLTLINAVGYPQASWPPAIALGQVPVIDDIMAWHVPRFVFGVSLKDVYHEEAMVTETLVDRYHELALREGNLRAFTDRVKADLDSDSERIASIAIPTLVLWGEEDGYFPVENAHRFHRDIKESRLVTYDNVGHLPMEEAPARSLQDFRGFLAELSAPKQVSANTGPGQHQ